MRAHVLKPETFLVDDLELDPRVEARNDYDPDKIEEYGDLMANGKQFPPISVFEINSKLIVVDGWYRVKAALQSNIKLVECSVYRGLSLQDAIIFAANSNSTHGVHRSPLDKRKSVKIVLGDANLRIKSNNEIATICNVSHPFVSRIREEMIKNGEIEKTSTFITANGKTMKTRDLWKDSNNTVDLKKLSGEYKAKDLYSSNLKCNPFANHIFDVKLKRLERMKRILKNYYDKNSEIEKRIMELKNKFKNNRASITQLEIEFDEGEHYIASNLLFEDILLGRKFNVEFDLP